MQINQSTLAALFKGYKTQFLENYHAGKPIWEKIAMRTASAAAEEIYHWLGSFPGMKKLVGEIKIENLTAARYAIINDEWENTIGVKRADIERDSYGIYEPRFRTMGLIAKKHPDHLVASLLVNGFVQKDYTGKNFFDANKVQDPSGKVTLTNKLTVKLNAASYATARTMLKSVLNSRGEPMDLGENLILICSPANETVGKQILQADFLQQIATNKAGTENIGTTAVTNVNKGTAELLVWSMLADHPDMWFVIDNGFPIRPLIVQIEKEVEFTSLVAPDSDHAFLTKEFLYQAYGRYNAGYGMPQLAVGSTGADPAP